MKHQASIIFVVLIAWICVSCTNRPTATTALTATIVPTTTTVPTVTTAPSPSRTVSESSLKPGDSVGEMVLEIAQDDTGDIYNHCSPFIVESDPAVIVRTCNVPEVGYLFIGYGEMAGSLEELDSFWNNESWELYFDGNAVDLHAFGYFDGDYNEYKVRKWGVALENLTAGEHQLRYTISAVDKSWDPIDITWVFTVGEPALSSTPIAAAQKMTYPTLAPTIEKGQHPYTSEKSQLNFLLYLPEEYGNDPQQQWPLILYLHGAGERANNLDYLKINGLPKKLEDQSNFPFIVVSPQIEGENAYWSEEGTTKALFALLEEVQAVYSVDPKRIYLTGISLGGSGSWEIGLRYPERFAALVPVMGYYGYPFGYPDNICDLKDVPIWAFHGAKDEMVPLN